MRPQPVTVPVLHTCAGLDHVADLTLTPAALGYGTSWTGTRCDGTRIEVIQWPGADPASGGGGTVSNEQWRDGILGATTAELVDHNGADFLAVLLKGAVQEQRDLIARHHAEVRTYERANRGGLAVYRLALALKHRGRKTVRVDDLIAAMETP